MKRDFARPGLAAIWSFEDAADMGVERRDVAPLRMTNELTCATEDTLELVPGVVGQAIRFKGGTTTALKMTGTILSTPIATDGKLPAGNEPLTISFWLRPDIAGCGAYPNFLRFWDGNWTGLNGIWFRTPSDTFQSLVMSTEHGWNVKQTNDPSRAVVVDFGSNAYLGDGDWHHVVGTYADQVITLYVDGVSRGSNNLGADMNIPAASQFRVGNFSLTDANHKFAGDIDEIQILHGAWTAEEVAAEYAAKRPAADASLPAPIARWTFDELVDEGGMKLFKDAGPNGWDLVNTPSNGVYVANPAMTYPEDFGGRYAALPATAGPYLRLKSGVTMTDALPQGSSFTVSARVRYPVSGVVLIFGDGTEAGSYRLGYSGCPRNIVAYVGANTCALYETSMYGSGGSTPDAAWQLVTATYNAQAKIVRTFLDGVPMNEVTGQTVTINPTDLVFGVKTLPVPGPTTYSGFTHASIDELRIYDRALEADEVSRLARTFRYGDGTTVDDQVLSPDSPVVVDAGATLEATDGDHVAMSVSGAGAVNILLTATFAADDWSGFTGTVSGDGALLVRKGQTVPLPIASVTADAGFEDNTVVLDRATAAIPRVRASGRVLLPDTGTLKLADASTPGAWFGKTFVIAECGSYEGPSDTTGWTFDPAAEAGKPIQGEFKVIDGRLLLQTQGGGTAILIR